jgi:hypothetical protein
MLPMGVVFPLWADPRTLAYLHPPTTSSVMAQRAAHRRAAEEGGGSEMERATSGPSHHCNVLVLVRREKVVRSDAAWKDLIEGLRSRGQTAVIDGVVTRMIQGDDPVDFRACLKKASSRKEGRKKNQGKKRRRTPTPGSQSI